ncbi:MAG: phosphodiester glycosidase family protein [Armatimonadetes bacterium]|nr:phosphodiester glycosidase family protein [Armatimonadota bacterium]
MQVKYFGILGLLLATSHAAANQVWEKPVAPGLVYRMEITQDPPRVIHVLKLITSNPVTSVIPELGNRTVYDSKSDGRSTVSQMVKDTNALAAINADFFPFTGDPLGLMVREGQFISLPHPKRAAFAWGPNTSVFGFSRFSGSVTTEKGTSVDIDGLDEECQENRVTLNGPEAGISKAKNPCLTVVLKLDGGRLMPTTQIGASVIASSNDGANMPLKAGQFTLVAQGNKMSQLSGLKPGDRLTIKLNTTGFDWEKLDNAVGGGPLLLRNGEIAVDAENEGFGKDFVDTRHPRTAVGRTGDGDLVFVTVDGRQKVSVGATLGELAEIMQGLGCRDALNLDGGGSTCMNIFGLDMSRPSDKTGERPVANGIAFYGPKPLTADQKLKIVVPASMNVNGTVQAKVVDKDGREVPNIEVFWSLQGAAWVDQGGQVSGLQEGTATLQAYVRGTILSTNITVKQP